MRVKIDEELSRHLLQLFAEFGHTAQTVQGQGWAGYGDDELWPLVQRERELLVTADVRFGNVVIFPPGPHAGVLLVRAAHESWESIELIIRRVLRTHPTEGHVGALLIADDAQTRVRRSAKA